MDSRQPGFLPGLTKAVPCAAAGFGVRKGALVLALLCLVRYGADAHGFISAFTAAVLVVGSVTGLLAWWGVTFSAVALGFLLAVGYVGYIPAIFAMICITAVYNGRPMSWRIAGIAALLVSTAAHAQVQRNFPADALRGTLEVLDDAEVQTIDNPELGRNIVQRLPVHPVKAIAVVFGFIAGLERLVGRRVDAVARGPRAGDLILR